MSIPYIPGWWDQLAPSVLPLTQKISERIHPDEYAAKRLQDMVQQNPMLMEQFSNLDDNTRAMLAQSLGFKNVNPLANLPVGQQRKDREEIAAFMEQATPEQRQERLAKRAGVTPIGELQYIQRRRDFEDKMSNFQLNAAASADQKQKELDAAAAAAKQAYPDLAKIDFGKIAKGQVWSGKTPDSNLATLIESIPGIKTIYENSVKIELERFAAQARKDVARIKDPNEKSRTLAALTAYGNQLNMDRMRLQTELSTLSKDIMTRNANASRIADINKELVALQNNATDNNAIIGALSRQEAASEGIVLPPPRNASGVSVSDVVRDIRAGKISLEQALSSSLISKEEKDYIKKQVGGK